MPIRPRNRRQQIIKPPRLIFAVSSSQGIPLRGTKRTPANAARLPTGGLPPEGCDRGGVRDRLNDRTRFIRDNGARHGKTIVEMPNESHGLTHQQPFLQQRFLENLIKMSKSFRLKANADLYEI